MNQSKDIVAHIKFVFTMTVNIKLYVSVAYTDSSPINMKYAIEQKPCNV